MSDRTLPQVLQVRFLDEIEDAKIGVVLIKENADNYSRRLPKLLGDEFGHRLFLWLERVQSSSSSSSADFWVVSSSSSPSQYSSSSADATPEEASPSPPSSPISSRRRTGEVLRVVLLFVKFLLALAFFAPMAVYEFVEFVLLGEASVTLAQLMMNLLNCYFEWTTLGVAASVIFVTLGVVTHLWRCSSGKADRERLSPTAIIVDGLKEVRERAVDRSRTETKGLERLRGAAPEVPPQYYDARVNDPVIIDEGPSSFIYIQVKIVKTRAPAAITAELRAAEERSALLRLELA
ncbi:unnamed protein product [Phytophthora fragariaefolia]|uniref:Unnamed protein product n=1 Tax=Phytophthora fragariaefolia TaxID=1490495 RepID=A0A9W6TWW7_9STRA|nr:unnamed protein product [Phytophthora fragariaefolia]